MFLLPGDWVYNVVEKKIGVVRSSNDKTAVVWYSRTGVGTVTFLSSLRTAHPLRTHSGVTNIGEIPYLAEMRARWKDRGLNQSMDPIQREDIREELERKYGSFFRDDKVTSVEVKNGRLMLNGEEAEEGSVRRYTTFRERSGATIFNVTLLDRVYKFVIANPDSADELVSHLNAIRII